MISDEDIRGDSYKKLPVEKTSEAQSISESTLPEEEFFGPKLPPSFHQKKLKECSSEQKIYGPVLPENLRKNSSDSTDNGCFTKEIAASIVGPSHSESLQTSVDDENDSLSENETNFNDIGPSPSLIATEDDYKSKFIYRKKENNDSNIEKPNQRETWMLEPPKKKSRNFLSSLTKFSKFKDDDKDDQSAWTDTPADKINKKNKVNEKDYKAKLLSKMLDERNKEMEKLVEKYLKKEKKSSKATKKSLLEKHAKKMKKKKKKEKKERDKQKPERRPFNRDVDLKIHRVDESRRKLILNNAGLLSNRFASGESKFL